MGTERSVRRQRPYIKIVEKALGRPLRDEVVHHVDLDRTNDRNGNLVVCPDQAYHMLLHRRTNARRACGNANAFPCQFCKGWDESGVNGMQVYYRKKSQTGTPIAQHSECSKIAQRERRAA